MAKKKAVTKHGKEDNRPRLEIRFDPAVYPQLQDVAERVGVSVNRVMNALAWMLVTKGRINREPVVDPNEKGKIEERKQEGVIWFGTTAEIVATEFQGEEGIEVGEVVRTPGYVAGVLDFTEKRVVRDD